MQDETMIVLAEYNTITEAEIAKSILASSGVREEDYEKARAMLHHR